MKTLFLLLLILTACSGAQPQAALATAVDPGQAIIFHNGVVLTMEEAQPAVEAIAIRGEKIEALGSDIEILALQGPATTVIDLAGRTLMPGFVDAHTHILNDARALGRSLDQAQYLALRNGITTLGDLYVDEPFLREIQAFAERGALRVRTSLYMVANTNCGANRGRWYQKYPPTRQAGEMLRVGGVKIFTDGGSCGGVALSFELEPGRGQGDLWLTQEALNEKVLEAQSGGYQVAIHAIGDRAVAQGQAAIAYALGGGPNVYRHRMEHLSVLRPEFLPRFGEMGIVPVLNGQYPACTPFGPPIPEPYHAWEWPWRELRSENPDLPIAWHSDYPYLSINPFVHLYGFVTRNDVFQAYTCRAGDWLLDDTLTVPESLSIMTIQSAYALFREEEVGSLRPGKYADVIVISGDPNKAPANELKSLSVLATMVGGRFEYCDPRNPDLCPGYEQRRPAPLPDYRPPVPIRWLVLGLSFMLPLAVGFWNRLITARSWLPLLGSVAGVIGGALWFWVWVFYLSLSDDFDAMTWPLVVASVLLAIAAVGLAHILGNGRLGVLGLATTCFGMFTLAGSFILSFWFSWEPAWLLIWVGMLGHAIGLTLVGLANIRAKRTKPLYLLPLATGLVGGLVPLIVGFVAGESYRLPIIIVGSGIGIGWLLIGLLAWKDAA